MTKGADHSHWKRGGWSTIWASLKFF